jgi:hypothetical protein
MRAVAAMLLGAVALPAGALERLEEFAYSAPLEVGGAEALQGIEIPQAVYEGSVQPRLADLRVFNAAGEPVPFAFVPRRAPDQAQAAPVTLRFFPLHGTVNASVQDLDIRAERTPDGTVVRVRNTQRGKRVEQAVLAYLVDASEHKAALRTLELDWKPFDQGFSGRLQVEGSEDLEHWTSLVATAPLLELEFGRQRLQRKSVELPGTRYRYLRLSWPAGQPALALTALAGRPAPAQVEPERRWKALTVAPGQSAGEYLFDVGGRFPVDRLRVDLPEPNTLIAVEVLTRDRAQDAWHSVARSVVYRLVRNGVETASPPIPVYGDGARHWLMRVDQKGGGIGSAQPAVHAGWVPEQLVFVARGAPPFVLAYGNARAAAAAYPIATLVPGWRADEPLTAARASVGAQRDVAGPAALRARADYRTWLLWLALVAGVAILGWMAWQLARQMKRGESA